MLWGFIENRDITPKFLSDLPLEDRLKKIIVLFNWNFGFNISLKYANSSTISSIFVKFIKDELFLSQILNKNLKPTKSICISSNILIQSFLHHLYKPNLKTYNMDVARLIDIIYSDKNNLLMLDCRDLFCNYIYHKIVKCNKNIDVKIEKDRINIKRIDGTNLILIVCFDEFNFSFKSVKMDIKKAFDISKDIDGEVYIIYPRQNGLKKFVKIIGDKEFYGKIVKIVPYSITNIIMKGCL